MTSEGLDLTGRQLEHISKLSRLALLMQSVHARGGESTSDVQSFHNAYKQVIAMGLKPSAPILLAGVRRQVACAHAEDMVGWAACLDGSEGATDDHPMPLSLYPRADITQARRSIVTDTLSKVLLDEDGVDDLRALLDVALIVKDISTLIA